MKGLFKNFAEALKKNVYSHPFKTGMTIPIFSECLTQTLIQYKFHFSMARQLNSESPSLLP